ncbi:nickel ABC transporter substrate-binding protein [Chroogloeocystis siderophila]|jgi:nickel transport system substrate-binding protein|uniref:Nickel ABC transporter, nickel/metallophore periplasmic binding protein n=1 Tax=Chroogloeocystis siderophila 5.2 s.c.1 TaxID=247279 RepID=A0A1U7HM77_9CHRO|nr:nickel ABC transporter substrate-binding protein [Chroogloeocystis siderophila]OKH24677.1 nickel ABC transporter, nickel/metallophore periplasmic binding protein [Chroogloeocystis siderophila 5.2 s.c.1]
MSFLGKVLLPLAIAASVVLPSCTRPQAETNQQENLVFSWSQDIGPLNPHLYGPSQMFAQDMVFESLVNYGRGGEILPALAESWEVSPDGRVMTFQLRQGVKFSDGEAFNATAAKLNFDQILANAQAHDWLELIQQIDRVEAEDEYTLRIYLKNAYYPALQELTLIRPVRFLSPAAFPESGTTADGIKQPIGTGPWVLTQYSRDNVAVFRRNDNYWGELPAIEQVTVRVIPDGETRVVAFESGELDLIYGNGVISLDAFERLQKSGRYQAEVSQPLSTRAIAIHSGRGPTQELAVRQAIQHSFNKDAVIQAIFYNTERRADTYFSDEVPYADINLEPYAYDVERANALLDEAGWTLPSGGSIRQKNGQSLTLELSFDALNNIDRAIAEALQADLRQVGIDLRLQGEERQAWLDRQTNGEFHLIFNNTWGPPYEPHAMVSSMRKPSHADYEAQSGLPMKAEIDQKIAEVLVSTDSATRQQLYGNILTTLHEQAVYLPISYSTNLAVLQENIGGFEFMPQENQVPLNRLTKR